MPQTRLLASLATTTLLALALVPAPAARAAGHTLTLDPAATDVSFTVEATGHDVHGHFALRDGSIRFDPETGTATGRIAIDATRGETGNGSRDKTMHQKVLESERYPLFVFEAKRFEGALPASGGADVSLVGTLTLHGAEHPLTLPAHVERQGERVEATTSFEVPYEEWGLHNPSLLFLRVADRVSVTVEAVGTLEGTVAGTAAGRR